MTYTKQQIEEIISIDEFFLAYSLVHKNIPLNLFTGYIGYIDPESNSKYLLYIKLKNFVEKLIFVKDGYLINTGQPCSLWAIDKFFICACAERITEYEECDDDCKHKVLFCEKKEVTVTQWFSLEGDNLFQEELIIN